MFTTGDRIGDWVVERPLGAGGMGSVYRCHNALTTRIQAAVKVVWQGGGPSEDARERFIREVEALESLQHPGIVRVKGWGETEAGELWLAMDLVEGQDLDRRLRLGPLAPDAAIRAFGPIVDGLAHAHARGVFHRDIKPANILLDPEGEGRLVDFGIAMQDDRTRVTLANSVPGTPAYLAPEVFGGRPEPRPLDIYALGQVLYEALTGTPAFPDPGTLTTTQRMAHVAGGKIRSAQLDPGPGIPDHLRHLVRAATHPDPRMRLASLDSFADALRGQLLDVEAAEPTSLFELPDWAAPTEEMPKGTRFADPVDAELLDLAGPDAPPELPAVHERLPPPAPASDVIPDRRSFLAGMGAAALGLVGLWGAARLAGAGDTPRMVSIRVNGLADGMAFRARLGQRWLEGSPPWTVDGVVGAQTLYWVSGDTCDVNAFPPTCADHCACQEVQVGAHEVDIVVQVPPVPELAGLRVRIANTSDAGPGARVEEGLTARGAVVVDHVRGFPRMANRVLYWDDRFEPGAQAVARAVAHIAKVTVEKPESEVPPDFDVIVWLPPSAD
ncbi:MAG: protein kinase [Alphaproteobacteria bacterium]|nr:protein kinase [Alphaproteobacteria bacterium]